VNTDGQETAGLSLVELLEITDPAVLFPDPDPKVRKRKYAKLVRRFRPEVEPEAFAHLRALYEQKLPVRPVLLQRNPQQISPAERLFEALQREDIPAMVELFLADEAGLYAEQPGVWEAALLTLLRQDLAVLPPSMLASIDSRLEGRATTEVEWAVERWIQLALTLVALREDPKVPDPVTSGLARWYPLLDDPEVAADALMEIGEHTTDVGEAERLWDHIQHHHPAALVPLEQLGRVLVRHRNRCPVVEAPAGLAWELDIDRTRRALRDGVSSFYGLAIGVFLLLIAATLFGLNWEAEAGWIVSVILGAGVLSILSRFRWWPDPRRRGLGARKKLEALCREHGLFPDELGQVFPAKPRGEDPGFPTNHGLILIGLDPGALARCISPALRARWSEG